MPWRARARARPRPAPGSASRSRARQPPPPAPRRRSRAARGGSASPRPVPLDRPLQAVVELDLRLPAEQLAGLLHVGDAQLDVDVAEGGELDHARAARE